MFTKYRFFFGIGGYKSFISDLREVYLALTIYWKQLSKLQAIFVILILFLPLIKITQISQTQTDLEKNLLLYLFILIDSIFVTRFLLLYWFSKKVNWQLNLVLQDKKTLQDFVNSLKKNNFFASIPLENEYVVKDVSQAELLITFEMYSNKVFRRDHQRRFTALIILFTLPLLFLNFSFIFLTLLLLLATWLYTYIYEHYANYVAHETIKKVATALYQFHHTYPQKCKNYITKSEYPEIKQLEALYEEIQDLKDLYN